MPTSLSTSQAALTLDKVVFGYGAAEVLHEISFSIERGEVVGLLGPNGAGKSTTIKIVAGILSPNSGTVSVCGLNLPRQAIEVKQKIGYVPEAAGLFESLTGQEFLELVGRLHDIGEDILQTRIAEMLETFGLSGDRASRLDTYSKGMRQKILLSSALLHNPELILLDEPLSGLDVNAAILVKDLIAALASDGKTILYSSHVLDVVERVCDRVMIIHQGNLVANSTPASLKASTGQSTLEDVFRHLTQSARVDPSVARVIDSLRS
jgi:ABC-2 type transport system ATP-binding protein